jgi:hypothetical protein
LFSVSIVPDEESYAHVVRGKIIRKFADFGEPDERQRRQSADAAVISLAGPNAEARFTGHEADEVGAFNDRREALELVEYMRLGSDRQVDAFLEFVNVRAEDLVDDRHDLIEAIATALVEHRRLSRTHVLQICREASQR